MMVHLFQPAPEDSVVVAVVVVLEVVVVVSDVEFPVVPVVVVSVVEDPVVAVEEIVDDLHTHV